MANLVSSIKQAVVGNEGVKKALESSEVIRDGIGASIKTPTLGLYYCREAFLPFPLTKLNSNLSRSYASDQSKEVAEWVETFSLEFRV